MIAANQARQLDEIFAAAIARVEPGTGVRRHLVICEGTLGIVAGARTLLRLDRGSVWMVAAGKAAAGMARAALPLVAERLAGGVVVSPAIQGGFPQAVEEFAAGHPLPNKRSLAAGHAVWGLVGRAEAGQTVLVLLSGGASSLLVLPAPGISLADKIRSTELLLRAGAGIAEINTVRKHLSRIKGGGLARRAGRARVVCLLLSDVTGNPPGVIGSGPTAADPTTFADAWRVLERRKLLDRVPPAVRRRLDLGRRGRAPETLKPGEARSLHVVVGDVTDALKGAAERARALGLEPRILTARLRGDTRLAAKWFAAKIDEARKRRKRKLCLLAGGETTVNVRGTGKGGRNQEFALVLGQRISGLPGVVCLSAGTDGIDGPTDAAGAYVDSTTIARAWHLGLEPEDALERNDSYRFFSRLGDLFCPGATGTNVTDVKIAILH